MICNESTRDATRIPDPESRSSAHPSQRAPAPAGTRQQKYFLFVHLPRAAPALTPDFSLVFARFRSFSLDFLSAGYDPVGGAPCH